MEQASRHRASRQEACKSWPHRLPSKGTPVPGLCTILAANNCFTGTLHGLQSSDSQRVQVSVQRAQGGHAEKAPVQ